ncbi:MAG TPA: hypothetical protein VFB50_09235 [Chloroflexota bacterium]|nr:hypothetical protein [Chloroflexota bacterium]
MSDPYFRWLHGVPSASLCPCDCAARAEAFKAGRRLGRREALQMTAYQQVVPLLQALLDELVDNRIDEEFESLEPSSYWRTK